MRKLLLLIIAVTVLIASCSSMEQKKWDRNWEGPVISPSTPGESVPDRY